MDWTKVEINKSDFFKWLKNKPDGEVIGIKASCGKCPLAQYLNEVSPLGENKWWIVNGTHYYPFHTGVGKVNLLDLWAQKFVEEIDNYITHDSKATKEMCIQVMIEHCL